MPKTTILVSCIVAVGLLFSMGAATAVQTPVTVPDELATSPQPLGGKVGACIVPGNGNCVEVTQLLCLLINGDFQGPGSECPPEPKHESATSPQPLGGKVGACIVPGNGNCVEVTQLLCLLINGDFQGPGSECPPEPK